MKYIECPIKENVAYLIPIGDLHLGDRSFNKESYSKLIGYLEWVKANPNARIFLNGDIFNVAGRDTKTSPFDTEIDEYGRVAEYNRAIEIFKPYASQIIGATDGGHEGRLLDKFGLSPIQSLCRELGICYCGWSAVVRFMVGKRKDSNRYYQNYFIYFHHLTGSSSTLGGKLNRTRKLSEIVEGCDVYVGNHLHSLSQGCENIYYPSMQGGVKIKKRWFVQAGSYLNWENSYAEKGMMTPAKLGSPRIRFDGRKGYHDIHISI